MNTIATTKLSSKGQVVIPENIREQMGLHAGSQFVVLGEQDVVILKSISSPSMAEFDSLIKKTRSAAKQAGITKKGLKTAITKTKKNRK